MNNIARPFILIVKSGITTVGVKIQPNVRVKIISNILKILTYRKCFKNYICQIEEALVFGYLFRRLKEKD